MNGKARADLKKWRNQIFPFLPLLTPVMGIGKKSRGNRPGMPLG